MVRDPLLDRYQSLATLIIGKPIRECRDQRLHAPTPTLSQLATPFFAFQAKPSTKRRQCIGDTFLAVATMHDIHQGNSLPSMSFIHDLLDRELHFLSRYSLNKRYFKEVIRPHVPVRPPCYDFSPLVRLWFDSPNMKQPHQSLTRVKRRAVCARSRDVFTAR